MAAIIAISLASCQKEQIIEQVSLAKVQFVNKTLAGPDSILAQLDNKEMLPGAARAFDNSGNIQFVTEGTHTFTFFAAGNPGVELLKATLTVEKGKTNIINLFSVNATDPLQIINAPTGITDPTGDSVKISLANFTTDMLENTDIELIQQTKDRRPFVYVSAGFIRNFEKTSLGKQFTPYVTVPANINTRTGLPTYEYFLVPVNRLTGERMVQNANGAIEGTLKGSPTNRILTGFIYGTLSETYDYGWAGSQF